MRRAWIFVGMAVAAVAAAARADEPPVVRVISMNLWGVPGAPDRAARMKAFGPAVAALRPHLVALQEVWLGDDQDAVLRGLAAAGLVHARRFPGPRFGSGLLVASVWPLAGERFTPFDLGGKPHAPWHGDWWGGKGVAVLRVATPHGQLLVADTHLHASYGTDEYLPTQVAQALQVGEAVGPFGASPPPELFDAARPPLVLLGDLNVRLDTPAFDALCARAALRPAARTLGIASVQNWVLLRDGGAVGLRARKVEHVLEREVDLGERRGRLSDHPGVLAELQLVRRTGPPRIDPRPADAILWTAASRAARPVLERGRDAARERAASGRARCLALVVVSVVLLALGRRRKGKAGCAVNGLALTLVHVATWLGWLAFVFEPLQAHGLEAALRALGP